MRVLWLLLLVALPVGAAQPVLVAVAPDLPGGLDGDEGFAVAAADGGPLELGGYVVSDGEGSYRFPDDTLVPSGKVAWVVANGSTWSRFGGPPAAVWDDGRLALANGGDGLRLLDPVGQEVDRFSYGPGQDVSYLSPGLVYRRLPEGDGYRDTDAVGDWLTPRLHRVGESALDSPTFEADAVTLFVAPDGSFDVLTGVIGNATERLHLHVYLLSHAGLVDALVEQKRAHPDLDLQVLVEGSPVGWEDWQRERARGQWSRIVQVGGEVWVADDPGRYRFHHLKVLVADDAVVVQSENWVASGAPEGGSWGNRGWGAVVSDPKMADWSAGWMQQDRTAWDVSRFDATEPGARFVEPTGHYGGNTRPLRIPGPVTVRPVVAPDHTAYPQDNPIFQLAASATHRLDVQHMDLRTTAASPLGWSSPDGLATAIATADQNGASVRVQAAAPFDEWDRGNQRALDALAQRAPGARLSVFNIQDLTLHNKGIIADDAVVLGSINGNHHSRSENREAALILEHPEAAAYFRAVFDQDFAGGRHWKTIADDLTRIAASLPMLLVGVLVAAAWAWRSRPG